MTKNRFCYKGQKIYKLSDASKEVEIFFVDVRELQFTNFVSDLYFYNDVRVTRIQNIQQKRLSIAAALLTNFCADLYAFDVTKILTGETGKPFIKHSIYSLSISHAGNFAVCCISKREIGIDIERIIPLNYPIIVKNHFSKREQFLISETNIANRQRLFFNIWVLKESFLKNTGLGLSIPLNSFDFTPINKKHSLFIVNQHINKKCYYSRLFKFKKEDYSSAYCIEL